jgi:flagellar basal-body rod protein FlgC
MDALTSALKIAASGLSAQSDRLRVVSENLANAQSTGNTPGADPYRRKTISFVSELDRASGGTMVEVNSIDRDPSDFPVEFQPRLPTTRATSRCPTSTCWSRWPT